MEDLRYLSIGSAGMGIFSYLGLMYILSFSSRSLFDKIEGCIGCSAGSYISLLVALGLHKNTELLYDIFLILKQNVLISNNKLLNVGIYANDVGKNISCELGQLVEFTLEKCGFSSKISLGDLQKHLSIKLAIVITDIKKGNPVILDAENYYNMPIVLAIQMSTAVPFLNPPIKYEDIFAIDGGVLQSLNMDYYPKKETFFIYCSQTYAKMGEEIDIISYSSYLIECFQKQHDRLTDIIMEEYPHIKVTSDNIFKFMDANYTLVTDKLDKLFVSGCIKSFEFSFPIFTGLIGSFILNLSRIQLSV